MNFDESFEKLLGHEGGYVNNPHDPGKETKFGISKRTYPREDIPNLTIERAKFLYFHDFWNPAGCGVVPEALRFFLFDFAVNSGPEVAVKHLQKILGEFPDGIIGPKTLGAISAYPLNRLIVAFLADRLFFMAELPTWPAFGRGWAKRIAENLHLALKDLK